MTIYLSNSTSSVETYIYGLSKLNPGISNIQLKIFWSVDDENISVVSKVL